MIEYPYSMLTAYFLKENNIKKSTDYEISSIPARDLINENRFDLLAKLIYIDAREKAINIDNAIDVYKDSINAFSCGSFCEPGTATKNSFNKYLEQFNELIDNIKAYGFDEEKSLIPVDCNNVIYDGAHRVAVSAYYNKTVKIIKFPQKKLRQYYDYSFFQKNLMNVNNMQKMAALYAKMFSDCFFVCIWPKADRNRIWIAEGILKKYGKIVYEQDVYLNKKGMHLFMSQIYGHQAWTGSMDNKYEPVQGKVELCFNKKNPIKTYLVKADSLQKILIAKKEIRDCFQIDNHSIHISDSDIETREMVELLYNTKSRDYLNNAEPFTFRKLNDIIVALKRYIVTSGDALENYIIVGDAIKELYGVSEAKNISILTTYTEDKKKNFDGTIIEKYIKYVTDDEINEIKSCPEKIVSYFGCKLLVSQDEDFNESDNIPIEYREETIKEIHDFQIENCQYGRGTISLKRYKCEKILNNKIINKMNLKNIIYKAHGKIARKLSSYIRKKYIQRKRSRLKNTDVSIISSNCNGGVIYNDLGLEFKSPFINLFIRADDYIKLLKNLKDYMDEELVFVKELDDVYGYTDYPTAYLKDVKIYFMHYKNEEEALEAWERRKKRINWDNLYIIFTDRSQCTKENLEEFDKLDYPNKVVFTHLPYPNIKSSFYIRGYEEEEKVPVLSQFVNLKFPVRRIYDQFDYVAWLNGEKRKKDNT